MKKYNSHFDVWHTFAKDPVFRFPKIAQTICDELVQIYDFRAEVYDNDQHILSVGSGNNTAKTEILFCSRLAQAYIDDRHPGAGYIKKADSPEKSFGFWQEIMVSLFMECGLDCKEDPSILNHNFSELSFLETLAASSIKLIEKSALETFLHKHSLPLPSKIFSDKIPNTDNIHKHLHADSSWQVQFDLTDVRLAINGDYEELQAHNTALNPNNEDIEEVGQLVIEQNNAKFIFAGKPVTVKHKIGHSYLKYLFEHANISVPTLRLYREFHGSVPLEQKMEIQDMNTESNFEASDETTKGQVRDEIIKLKQEAEYCRIEGDYEAASAKEKEIEECYSYLRDNFDSLGRPRQKRTANEEKCRNAVCNAIKYCFKEFTKPKYSHRLLYEHLTKKGVFEFGYDVRYNSPPGTSWKTQ